LFAKQRKNSQPDLNFAVLTKHTVKHQTNAWVTLTRPLTETHKQTVQQEKQIQKDEEEYV
jgi:hypothetical protein